MAGSAPDLHGRWKGLTSTSLRHTHTFFLLFLLHFMHVHPHKMLHNRYSHDRLLSVVKWYNKNYIMGRVLHFNNWLLKIVPPDYHFVIQSQRGHRADRVVHFAGWTWFLFHTPPISLHPYTDLWAACCVGNCSLTGNVTQKWSYKCLKGIIKSKRAVFKCCSMWQELLRLSHS